MENLKQFIEKIQTTWRSTESLPDLLEFSELIQHQQNQFMRQQFNEIMNNQVFPKQNDFIQNIQETLTEIEKQQINNMKGQFDQIRKEFIEKLTTIKNEKKISKKVFTKYVNMVKDRINSEISAFNLAKYSEIKTQETNLQKKKGFIQIDLFIQGLLKKEEELQEYKKDENKIKMKFNKIWGQITNQHTQQQEDMFKVFCDKLLQVIQQEFSKYILKTNNEPFYKQEYHQKLIKKAPEKGDFLTSLKIFSPELQTQQFMVVEKSNKNYQYYENFCQNNYILKISKFYSYKIEQKWISKNVCDEYIRTDLSSDIQNYFKEKQKYDIYAVQDFLFQFTIFGYEIDENQSDEVFSYLRSFWNIKQNLPQLLISCFKPNQRKYYNDEQYQLSIAFIIKYCKCFVKILQKKEQIISLQENLENLIKPFDQGENFLVVMQQTIVVDGNVQSSNLDLLKLSYDSTITQKSNTQIQNHNNIGNLDQQKEISCHRQNFTLEIFNFIQNQKENYHQYNQFKNYVVKVVQQLMNDNHNDGWNKMYGEIHQMILDEIIDINKNAIVQENENIKVNQYSFSLINRIMQKIE